MNGFSLYTEFQPFHYDLDILCSLGPFIILYKNSWPCWRPCHVFFTGRFSSRFHDFCLDIFPLAGAVTRV